MKNSEGKILLLPGDGIGPEVNKALKDVINSADANTAINIEVEEDVVGGGRKTEWKLHKKGIKDIDILLHWINACIPEAAFQISGGESNNNYGAAIFDKKGFQIHQCW